MKTRSSLPAILASALAASVAFGQPPVGPVAPASPPVRGEALPGYRPERSVTGQIRIWASPADAALLRDWEEGFRKFQAGAGVVASLHGPESAMMGVYTGVADLALMGREMRQPAEVMAFTWAWRYAPTSLEVAGAGADTPRPFASLAVFVHRGNPLARLTLAQLDAVFGAEHRRGASDLRTWGQLGLTGAWRERPIHVFGPAVDSVPALFFRQAVLLDSYKWNDGLVEFADDRAMLAALARDESAIAYAPLRAANPGVKPLPLAAQDGGEAVPLTDASVAARTYPLARTVTVVLNRAPGAPLDPKTKEFLRFVLSAEGQAAIARDGGCVPLSAARAREQRKQLE